MSAAAQYDQLMTELVQQRRQRGELSQEEESMYVAKLDMLWRVMSDAEQDTAEQRWSGPAAR